MAKEELSRKLRSEIVSWQLTSTTAAVCFRRCRRAHMSQANHPDTTHIKTAHILNPVVPHQASGASNRSKLAARAHQPQMKREKGIAIAVAVRTGRTVFCRRYKNNGGKMMAGMMRTNSKGSMGIIDGRRGASIGA